MRFIIVFSFSLFLSFQSFGQLQAKRFSMAGNARFQSVYDDEFNIYSQWAAYPKVSYFLKDFFSLGIQVLYRNDQRVTQLENEFLPNYHSQALKDLGFSLSSRWYFNPAHTRLNWFADFEYMNWVTFGEFDPPFSYKPHSSNIKLSAGLNVSVSENIAIETALHFNLSSFNNLFITTGIVIQSFEWMQYDISAKNHFLKQGTIIFNPLSVLSFQKFTESDFPTFLNPSFSIFLSDRLLFQNSLSIINYHERSDLKRFFFRYEPGFQWFVPISKMSFLNPKFRIQYANVKTDRDSRITKFDHFSCGFEMGLSHTHKKYLIYMGMELSYWNNFRVAEKLSLDGKTQFSWFIIPNVKLDLKANLNFLNPRERLEEFIYSIETKKAVEFEFGFGFYIPKK